MKNCTKIGVLSQNLTKQFRGKVGRQVRPLTGADHAHQRMVVGGLIRLGLLFWWALVRVLVLVLRGLVLAFLGFLGLGC